MKYIIHFDNLVERIELITLASNSDVISTDSEIDGTIVTSHIHTLRFIHAEVTSCTRAKFVSIISGSEKEHNTTTRAKARTRTSRSPVH